MLSPVIIFQIINAHKLSDEYVNVSIIEKDAVLAVAQEKKIAGIMSFACDPGVVTAAYVAEKMGLPFQCSYAAATILQDKVFFVSFCKHMGLIVRMQKVMGTRARVSSATIGFFAIAREGCLNGFQRGS